MDFANLDHIKRKKAQVIPVWVTGKSQVDYNYCMCEKGKLRM